MDLYLQKRNEQNKLVKEFILELIIARNSAWQFTTVYTQTACGAYFYRDLLLQLLSALQRL